MLAIERRSNINDYLQIHQTASVEVLATMLKVTEETIRRDLRQMEQEGLLERTHGGAFLPERIANTLAMDARGKVNQSSKIQIARESAALIDEKDTLFLDASTTSAYLAQELLSRNLTIITNSFTIANIVAPHHNIHLIMLGGDYDAGMRAFLSPATLRELEDYYVDKAFFSCRSVDLKSGLTDAHETICALRKTAIAHCKMACCIADHSKFNHSSYIRLCGIADINALITDFELTKEWKRCLDDNNVWYANK